MQSCLNDDTHKIPCIVLLYTLYPIIEEVVIETKACTLYIYLVGLSDVTTSMNKHPMHCLENLWIVQNELRDPDAMCNVPHPRQLQQVALRTHHLLSGGETFNKAASCS